MWECWSLEIGLGAVRRGAGGSAKKVFMTGLVLLDRLVGFGYLLYIDFV